MENVVVHFRAHDLDRNKAWAATIETVYPYRRPMHIAPYINADELFDLKQVRADVVVTSIRNDDGEYVPSLYSLQKVYQEGREKRE